MKTNTLLLAFFSFLFALTSCNDAYNLMLETPKKTVLNTTATIKLIEKKGQPIEKIQFYIDGKEVENSGNSIVINTSDLGLGKHAITALAFFEGKTKKKNGTLEVFADKKPTIYSFKIINTYPHDKTAFTQGLEYYNGFIYETTGKKGASTLRKVDLKTGKVLQKTALNAKYFGEGMTIINNQVIWLTWQAKKGFVYDLKTFKQEKEFPYGKSIEGWGLTQNNTQLIKSDGTHKIYFLNKSSFAEEKTIQVYTNDRALEKINELEFINGKIYANYWLKPTIAIINPENGIVEGIIDLRKLKATMAKTQNLEPQSDVLNGIAFDKENNRLFVTGKNWGKLFEIALVKKQ